ncbi:MAG: hypothetical protein LBI08_03425 [Methanomassiliicoccaceae archaeon]|jgi:hypothetical protein|nr:hypothetical protein [Methanomassiliicoccaceae archaeon]
MAKKRRREGTEPEETYEFEPPKFDEREFLLKDLYGTKVLFVTILLAVIVGILARCLYEIHYAIGLALMFLTIVAFKQILMLLKFRADLLDQKTLIGNYILFMLLTLGVWIILLNPPF